MVWPNMIYTQPVPQDVNWDASTQQPEQTTYVSTVVTQQNIYETFDIIDLRLDNQAP